MGTSHRPAIERAMAYIVAHLDRSLRLDDIARVAGVSKYHFHRMFTATTGEPVGRFVTRRRLETAALRLAYSPAQSVTAIGFEVGYSSTANFSKAFSAFFGCSPSDVRRGRDPGERIGRLLSDYDKDFHPADLFALPPETPTAARAERLAELRDLVRFERTDGFDLACLASPNGYDLAAVTDLWAELVRRARELGFADADVDAWGISHDSPQLTAPSLCRYHAAVPCPPGTTVAAPLFPGRVPAGRYAVFPYAGPLADLPELYLDVYSVWLPQSAVEVDDFTPLDHHTGDGPRDGHIELEIWLKLR